MINAIEKLERTLSGHIFGDVRAAYITRVRVESGRIADTRQWMLDNGFDLVDAKNDELLTDDGREILRAHGKAWALRPEIHAKRLDEAIEQAKQRDAAMRSQGPVAAANNPPTTCSALIDGQLCGGVLSATSVCPKCALGKQGVAQIMTCDVCGAQTAVMR